MKNKRLAFLWDFSVDPVELHTWADGLSQALRHLNYKYNIDIKVIAGDEPNKLYRDIEEFDPDYILAWGSLDRPSFSGLKQFNVPLGLCFAGGTTIHPNTSVFDVIFCENKEYLEQFKEQGLNAYQAFGTNDSLFIEMNIAKKWKGIYHASFALWKRHNLFAEALKNEGLAVGKILEHDIEALQVCLNNNVTIIPAVPYEVLPFLINQSKYVVVTSSTIGGGQRNVLEAMSCNVPPIVMSDNPKNCEFVEESGFGIIVEPNTEAIREAVNTYTPTNKGRDYIMQKYSAEKYADTLYKNFLN